MNGCSFSLEPGISPWTRLIADRIRVRGPSPSLSSAGSLVAIVGAVLQAVILPLLCGLGEPEAVRPWVRVHQGTYLPALCGAIADGPPSKSAPQRVVIPFDFESKFDDGRYGQMVG